MYNYTTNTTKMSQKIPKYFYCENCKYKTVSKKDFNKHILTAKHKNTTNTTKKSPKNPITINHYSCECGKSYLHRASLFNHKKKCLINNEDIIDEKLNIDKDKMLGEMLKIIKEQQQQIMELIPKVGNTNITNNTNNTANTKKKSNINKQKLTDINLKRKPPSLDAGSSAIQFLDWAYSK